MHLDQAVDVYVMLFKELSYFPRQVNLDVDHIAGLREVVNKSEELATEAVKAAIFVTHKTRAMDVGVYLFSCCRYLPHNKFRF